MKIAQNITIALLLLFLIVPFLHQGQEQAMECKEHKFETYFVQSQDDVSVSAVNRRQTQSSWSSQTNDVYSSLSAPVSHQTQKRIILPLTKYPDFFSCFFRLEKNVYRIASIAVTYMAGRVLLLQIRILRI